MVFKMHDMALKESIKKHGKNLKQVICMEEMAELQKEVSKCIRGQGDPNHLTEEMADVLISVEMLRLIHGIKYSDIQSIIDYKVERQIRRDKGELE